MEFEDIVSAISGRTKASLSLYLGMHEPAYIETICHRNGIDAHLPYGSFIGQFLTELRTFIYRTPQEQLLGLLNNMVQTQEDMRSRQHDEISHDERWQDLFRCLLLDGYRIKGGQLINIEPTNEGEFSYEDDLTTELNRSGLDDVTGILAALDNSANDFRKVTPDYNGCLTNARVALQTLTSSIARSRVTEGQGNYDEEKWAQVVTHLRTSGLISKKEEEGITGVYSFISQGAHRPIGLDEQDMARLGRSLAVSMCYFLVKLNNG